jgi:hypothetical protein
MSFALISNAQSYHIVTITESFKNHSIVTMVEDGQSRKFGNKQIVYLIDHHDINIFYKNMLAIKSNIDITLLTELIEDTVTKFSIDELSKLYFGENYDIVNKTALLILLAEKSTDFDNVLDGSFRKLTKEEQETRISTHNKLLLEQSQYDNYYTNLINLQAPVDLTTVDIFKFLYRPDKNSQLHKAFVAAYKKLSISDLELCHKIGLLTQIEDYFVYEFMMDNFHQGINHSITTSDVNIHNLEHNCTLDVFSIDEC